MKKNTAARASPCEFKGMLPLQQLIPPPPPGLQHELAVFVGSLTPLMILCAICGVRLPSAFFPRRQNGRGFSRRTCYC